MSKSPKQFAIMKSITHGANGLEVLIEKDGITRFVKLESPCQAKQFTLKEARAKAAQLNELSGPEDNNFSVEIVDGAILIPL